jgi:hypothetical protein
VLLRYTRHILIDCHESSLFVVRSRYRLEAWVKLSLCIATKNSAEYIEKLLRIGSSFADEVVVAVDASSNDLTQRICHENADRVFSVESPGYVERILPWLNEQCRGDWILRLDDDELPSVGLIEILPSLMNDHEMTHYYLRRRTIVGDERAQWIAQRPWWPDWKLRLFRNIPSIVRIPGRLHTGYEVKGASRYLYRGSIYHYDFVYHDERHRKEKVRQYQIISPEKSGSHHYSLPDEDSLITRPIPADDAPAQDHTEIRPRAARAAIRDVDLAEIDRAAVQECDYGPALFRARLECVDCPRLMEAGRWYKVDVDLRNDSPVSWPLPEMGAPDVRVTYHWLKADGDLYDYTGRRTVLPHMLRPGETTRLPAPVRSPKEPGDYILQWDLIIPQVTWFSRQGWRGPEIPVSVEGA